MNLKFMLWFKSYLRYLSKKSNTTSGTKPPSIFGESVSILSSDSYIDDFDFFTIGFMVCTYKYKIWVTVLGL